MFSPSDSCSHSRYYQYTVISAAEATSAIALYIRYQNHSTWSLLTKGEDTIVVIVPNRMSSAFRRIKYCENRVAIWPLILYIARGTIDLVPQLLLGFGGYWVGRLPMYKGSKASRVKLIAFAIGDSTHIFHSSVCESNNLRVKTLALSGLLGTARTKILF